MEQAPRGGCYQPAATTGTEKGLNPRSSEGPRAVRVRSNREKAESMSERGHATEIADQRARWLVMFLILTEYVYSWQEERRKGKSRQRTRRASLRKCYKLKVCTCVRTHARHKKGHPRTGLSSHPTRLQAAAQGSRIHRREERGAHRSLSGPPGHWLAV